MGSNSSGFGPRREQANGSGLYVLDGSKHYRSTTYKNPTKLMESKLFIWLFTVLPPTGYSLIILLNIDNIKGFILFIVAILYGIARLIFYVIKQNQERRMRELDIREKKRWLDFGDPL
jgi:hypothetical protein